MDGFEDLSLDEGNGKEDKGRINFSRDDEDMGCNSE
jgi:hypothetical protein